MLSDKKTGAVFAENEEEAAWYNVAEGIKQDIHIIKLKNVKAQKDLKLGAREIEKKFKNGARAVIKANNQTIKVQKEFLKLAESKLKI